MWADAEVSSIQSVLFWGGLLDVCTAVRVKQGHDNECGLPDRMWVVVRESKQVMSDVLGLVLVVSRNSRLNWCQITRVSSKYASCSSKIVTQFRDCMCVCS